MVTLASLFKRVQVQAEERQSRGCIYGSSIHAGGPQHYRFLVKRGRVGEIRLRGQALNPATHQAIPFRHYIVADTYCYGREGRD